MTILKRLSTKISKPILVLMAILAIWVIYWQATKPLWRGHLEVDTWNYFLKVEDINKSGSFFTKIGNEILPATTIFLLIPGWFIKNPPFYYSAYLPIFFFLIVLTLFYHIFLAAKYGSVNQAIIFSLLILSFGPILLFRFDALAALLVVLSMLCFKKEKLFLSAILLGLVTSIKVYPIIFLPYLLLILFNKKPFKKIISYLVYFGLGLIVPIFVFFILGGQSSQIIEGLDFHALKYVSIESMPGSLITLSSLLTQSHPPQLIGGWGVWGITSPIIKKLGLSFFNEFWFFPVTIFYLFLIKNKQLLKKINFGIIFCLMLLFLVFSKNLHAQYIWWFLSLFPFIKINLSNRLKYLFISLLLIFINVSNQLVYPIFYTQFLEDFFKLNRGYAVFYFLLFRNLSILALLLFSLKQTLLKKSFT